MDKDKYPEELTEKESERYEFNPFNDSNSYDQDYKDAVSYAKAHGGEVYTMVDGENNKTFYLKGFHFVNRFGYCVLKFLECKK